MCTCICMCIGSYAMTLGSQSYRYASYVARGEVRCKRRHVIAFIYIHMHWSIDGLYLRYVEVALKITAWSDDVLWDYDNVICVLRCICMHFNCFAEVSSLDCDYDESCMTLMEYLTILMGLSMLMLYMGCSLLYSSGWFDYYRWWVAFVQVYNATFL